MAREGEKGGGEGKKGATHISQVLHDVEEKLRLLEIVAHRLDRLADDQILGDLRPHDILLRLLGHEPPPAIPRIDDHLPRLHHLALALALPLPLAINLHLARPVGDELTPAHAIVPLPGDLLLGAAHAFHLHALRAGWHVDDGPVFGEAVVGFAHVGAVAGPAVVVVCFFLVRGEVVAAGGSAVLGRFAAGRGGRFAVDDDFVVVAAAVAGAAKARGC